MSSPRNVLVLKSSSLGDIIHTLPAISAFRKQWPGARITWLVKHSWAGILEGNPDIDSIWPVDFSFRSWPALIRRLRQGGYDLVLDFQGLFRSGLMSWLSGAPRRIGFAGAREGAPLFYTDHIDLVELKGAPWRLGEMHAVDRNLAIIRYLGADSSRYTWYFPDEPADQVVVRKLLQDAEVDEQDYLVALAPWSRAALKCWPLDRFVELSRLLITEGKIRPVLIGGSQDIGRASVFRDLEGQGLLNCVGKVSLRQLPVLLRQVRALIGNDSAPLHLAAGLGIPVVGLYGPTQPKATGPYPLDGHITVQSALPCIPCGQQTCRQPRYQECLQTIGVMEVFKRLCCELPSFPIQGLGLPGACDRQTGQSSVQVR
ncbi:MAG: glycosyltransferase family 9 protein [Nitrospirales bacterium]